MEWRVWQRAKCFQRNIYSDRTRYESIYRCCSVIEIVCAHVSTSFPAHHTTTTPFVTIRLKYNDGIPRYSLARNFVSISSPFIVIFWVFFSVPASNQLWTIESNRKWMKYRNCLLVPLTPRFKLIGIQCLNYRETNVCLSSFPSNFLSVSSIVCHLFFLIPWCLRSSTIRAEHSLPF